MVPALLVLDPQNDFFCPENPNLAGFMKTVPIINAAIGFFRRRGWPVVFVQHTSKSKPRGSQGWQIYEGFELAPTDVYVLKTRQNAFLVSDLEANLASRQVDRILLSGYVAEYCVSSTFRAAEQLGYQVIALAGGVASLDKADPIKAMGLNTSQVQSHRVFDGYP
jgi:nicotinamidase-related amidase